MSLSTWWPPRRRLALLAVLLAMATSFTAAALAEGNGLYIRAAQLYALLGVAALVWPALVTVQVVWAQLLMAALLVWGHVPAIYLVPVVAGVVATAELLTTVARLDTPMERDPHDAVTRMGVAAAVAAGVFTAVGLAASLPGPTGLLAVVIASAALAWVATLLVRRALRDGS